MCGKWYEYMASEALDSTNLDFLKILYFFYSSVPVYNALLKFLTESGISTSHFKIFSTDSGPLRMSLRNFLRTYIQCGSHFQMLLLLTETLHQISLWVYHIKLYLIGLP